MTDLFGCERIELLHSGPRASVYRGRRRADGLPVVVKVLDEASLSPRRLAALRHEHALLGACAGEGVVRVYGIMAEGARHGIVMEDFGGVPLHAAKLAGALRPDALLRLALTLAEIVEGVHLRRVVHKDINPSNLLINTETGQIKLIDFGISTVLADEEQGFVSVEALEGTLAYLSPEQTGRMNRPVDERTDLYALGVTLFELGTGRLPFLAEDPLELVHCHIARRPPSPAEINPSIPQVVADIILRLLAKNADDRYLSARSLAADLRSCLERIHDGGAVAPFPLGAHDHSDRIHFPQRLYGRDAETRALLDAFARAMQGAVLVLVSGYAGVGKTALIHEVHRPLTEQRGTFVSGKFDQLQNAPYSAFIEAFQALVGQVLTESAAEVEVWRRRIVAALGENTAVLLEACPALSAIVGSQSSPPPLPPEEGRHRLHEAVHQIVTVFARPEHPLCVFIDDLQWADADSLALLQELLHMARRRPLLLLGAYRDNEVGEGHPLRLTIRRIEEQGSQVERLGLSPLAPEDVTRMLADTLRSTPDAVGSLAELVVARTGGNPFFVRAFVTSLRAEGMLRHTPEGWVFDVDAIRRRGVTDNVVDLLASHLERLPDATRDLLRRAACVGNHFDLGTLARVAGRPVAGTGRDLWDAVVQGLVIPLDRLHSAVEASSAGPDLRFRFAHDRIQQAVLAALDEGGLARLSHEVGRRLLGEPGGDRERWLFAIVGQLNRGRAAISDPVELVELAELDLRAARKALAGASAGPALAYAQAGIALLSEEDWERRPDLARGLHEAAIDAAFGSGDLDCVQPLAAELLRRARTPLDEARVRCTEGKVLHAQSRASEAVTTFAELLGRLGFPLPSAVTPEAIGEEMQRTEEALARTAIEEIRGLPRCADEAARAALDVLSRLVFITTSLSHPLFVPVICKAVQISLAHGNTAESAVAYTFYGVLLAGGGDLGRAVRLGHAAIALSDTFDDAGVRSLVYLYASGYLIHWEMPLPDLVPRLFDAYRHGMSAGSPFSAACAAAAWCQARFSAGDLLGDLARDIAECREVTVRFRQGIVTSWLDIWHQTAKNLCEETADPTRLAGQSYDEDARLPTDRVEGGAMANYHICKLMLCYLFGDVDGAAAAAHERERYAALIGTSFLVLPLAMWDSLALLRRYERADEAERARILEAVDANERKLEAVEARCPENISHRLALMRAERARVEGRDADARAGFERAVALAGAGGYLHEEALAGEVAARFYLGKREVRAARDHLRAAHAGYLRWGAVTKARALEQELPHLVRRVVSNTWSPVMLTGTCSGTWDLDALDLVSVINASQAISREVEPDRLLVRLMELLIETGGAEAGALLGEQDGVWLVEAEKSVAARGRRGVPESVVNYVARTGEPLLLDDAAASPQFRRDPCIARHGIASVLCFPLPRKEERRRLVYLENNLMKGAFAPARIKILQLLSTQAVISLDNAVLYRTLEQRVEQRTHELSIKNDELSRALGELHEAQDRLIVQDRLASLGVLTAGVAHELRNPLNFVNNFAELSTSLLLDARDELGPHREIAAILHEVEENLVRIRENGRRMDGIISSMLEHSRGGQGERQQTDLNGLVDEAANIAVRGLLLRTPPIEVTLELDLDPAVGRVWMVPQEISRVILNLVDNAGYAANERRNDADPGYVPRVRVSTAVAGDSVEIRVHDNGCGVPAAIRDRLFNPFFTTKRPGAGTGLGLSIAHDIVVKSNRGSIELDSREGEFTELVVRLPRSTE